jgi:hypothetical protein
MGISRCFSKRTVGENVILASGCLDVGMLPASMDLWKQHISVPLKLCKNLFCSGRAAVAYTIWNWKCCQLEIAVDGKTNTSFVCSTSY